MKHYIIAGSAQSFERTILNLGLDKRDCKYVRERKDMVGLHNIKIIYGYGGCLQPAYNYMSINGKGELWLP